MTDRQTLIFLPGLLNDHGLWTHQVQTLVDVCDPVVADLTQDDSMAAMAQRVLANAPERFALAGLSMGGYLAFEILRQAPERVTRLALIDTSATLDSEARIAERRRGIEETRRHERFHGVTTRSLSRLIHPDHVQTPIGQEVRDMAQRVGGEAFIRQQQAIIDRACSRATLATITVPTMIAVGEQDLVTPPSEAEIMHRGIMGSSLHVIPRAGHLSPLEQPEAITALLRAWLAAEIAAPIIARAA